MCCSRRVTSSSRAHRSTPSKRACSRRPSVRPKARWSAGTAVARDQALAADQSAQGQITIDEANLRTAKINLGYTSIAAPVAGKVGKTNITKGNVVGPDSGLLTVIVSQDPMYVSFPVSQREFLRAQQAGRKADTKS